MLRQKTNSIYLFTSLACLYFLVIGRFSVAIDRIERCRQILLHPQQNTIVFSSTEFARFSIRVRVMCCLTKSRSNLLHFVSSSSSWLHEPIVAFPASGSLQLMDKFNQLKLKKRTVRSLSIRRKMLCSITGVKVSERIECFSRSSTVLTFNR